MEREEVLTSYSYAEPEPAYYEKLPSILDYITYLEETQDKDGNKVFYRKRLKPAHKDLYRVIRKLAGDAVCMRDTEYLARMAGCDKETIVEYKKILTMPIEQFKGDSLIKIDEKYTTTERDGKKINKKPVHICTINPIWKYNIPFMKKIFALSASDEKRLPPMMKETLSARDFEVAVEKMAQPSIDDIVYNSGADTENPYEPQGLYGKSVRASRGAYTENPYGHKHPKQTPLSKRQTPAAQIAAQLSLINQKDVEEEFSSEAKASDWLQSFGFKSRIITEMLGKYSIHEMLSSVFYIQGQLKNNGSKGSLTGYLLNTLKHKWWKPKAS